MKKSSCFARYIGIFAERRIIYNMKTKLANIDDKILLLILILSHVILLYLFCGFSKRPETYGDELIYIDIAKSIAHNETFAIHGVPLEFTNILYSIILAPLFLVGNTITRVNLITLVNCFLVSISLLPVYLICKEFNIKKKYLWIVLAIMYVWPDMLNAATFMSENLYFPISLFAMFFCIKMYKNDKYIWSWIAGVFSYLAYFCKEVGLCIPLACVATYFTFFILNVKEKRITQYRDIKKVIFYILSFLVSYMIVKIFFITGVQNFYMKNGAIDLALFKDLYKIIYLCYVLIYYLVACVIAFFVMPLVVPALKFKQLSQIQKKSYIFAIFQLLGTIMVIAITISIKEDLGKSIPRIHLRYFFPEIGLFLPLFFSVISNKEEHVKKNIVYQIWILISVLAIAIFKGVNAGCVTENMSLVYTNLIKRYIPDIGGYETQSVIFYPTAWIVVILISLSCFIYIKYKQVLKKEKAVNIFSFVVICICVVNLTYNYVSLRYYYKGDTEMITEMGKINNFFSDNNLDSANVMYIGTGAFSIDAKIYDLYFDAANREMELDYDKLRNLISNDDCSERIEDITFNEIVWATPYTVKNIDYFIVVGKEQKKFENLIDGIEKVDLIGGKEFYVYKNLDSSTLELKNSKADINISYTSENNNADLYTQSGLSVCEGKFTWSVGKEIEINVKNVNSSKAKVTVNVENTYNGEQLYIICKNNEILSEGKVMGKGQIVFETPITDKECGFTILLPNAISPKQNEGSQDERVLAIALSSILIEPK